VPAGRGLAVLVLLAALTCQPSFSAPEAQPQPQPLDALELPLESGSIRFAVIGDSGTGNTPQYEIGQRMSEAHQAFPFDFVIMLGDNLYGLERPADYASKFEAPYATLLQRGVKFYAALGNHDNPNQRFYEPFHMGGERYYSFDKGNARFFALDSNYMDERQLDWLERALASAREPWKLAFFHHPLYSSGGFHGPSLDLRKLLEPLFVKHRMQVVFSGHEHFYERIKPQKGVYYFIEGGSARLRRGNIRKTEITARGFDADNSFMLVEIAGDTLHFETIARTGARVEAGTIEREGVASAPDP
jgi:predicted phosphodiesterase